MGYYTGSGIVTDKNATVNELTRIAFKDANNNDSSYVVQQRTKTTVTVKNGVEMPNSVDVDVNLNDEWLTYWWYRTGEGYHQQEWLIPSCKGTKTERTYRRISDSNLCECVETNTALAIRVKQNNGAYSSWKES